LYVTLNFTGQDLRTSRKQYGGVDRQSHMGLFFVAKT